MAIAHAKLTLSSGLDETWLRCAGAASAQGLTLDGASETAIAASGGELAGRGLVARLHPRGEGTEVELQRESQREWQEERKAAQDATTRLGETLALRTPASGAPRSDVPAINFDGWAPGMADLAAAIDRNPAGWGIAGEVWRAGLAAGWDGIYAIYRTTKLLPLPSPQVRVGLLRGILDNANLTPKQQQELRAEYDRSRIELKRHEHEG